MKTAGPFRFGGTARRSGPCEGESLNVTHVLRRPVRFSVARCRRWSRQSSRFLMTAIRRVRRTVDITPFRGEAALSSTRPHYRHAGVAWKSHRARSCRVEVSRGNRNCRCFPRRFIAVRDDYAGSEHRRVCRHRVRSGQTLASSREGVTVCQGREWCAGRHTTQSSALRAIASKRPRARSLRRNPLSASGEPRPHGKRFAQPDPASPSAPVNAAVRA